MKGGGRDVEKGDMALKQCFVNIPAPSFCFFGSLRRGRNAADTADAPRGEEGGRRREQKEIVVHHRAGSGGRGGMKRENESEGKDGERQREEKRGGGMERENK